MNNRDYLQYEELKDKLVSTKIIWGELKPVKLAYVIPTYKRIDLLKRCVNSILNQEEVPNDFLIVISDNNPDTIEDFKVNSKKYDFFMNPKIAYSVNEKNIGGASNCNQAVLLADSEYICLIHDDDIVHPKHFTILKEFINLQNIDYVSFGLYSINKNKDVNAEEKFYNFLPKTKGLKKITAYNLYKDYYCPMVGALIKRKAYLKCGGLGKLSNMEDYIFTLKMFNSFNCYIEDCHSYGYTILENDALNDEIWADILCEKYNLRCFINKKWKLKKSKFNRYLLLARNIAYLESKHNIKKMKLDKNYIYKKINASKFLLNALVFFYKLIYLL